jgi:uncharacterized NAD(P)/FAD-binding protein YdhS
MLRVAIVGGGFSGTALAASLLRSGTSDLHIQLFEKTGEFGAGLAYSTQDPQHLLNVPASKMSALDEEPNHFAEWLSGEGIEGCENPDIAFVPRKHYRRYLSDLLEKSANSSPSELVRIGEEVVSISPLVMTASRAQFEADVVVLATGYLPETNFPGGSCFSPFRPDRWPDKDVRQVALIGSGLTALDAATTVFSRYPSVHVTAISKSGREPEGFDVAAPGYALSPFEGPVEVRRLVKWLRSEIEAAGNWQSVFNATRPMWEGLWQQLPQSEQRRFLAHLRSLFDRHRHRVPPATADMLASHAKNGSFQVIPGFVTGLETRRVFFTSHGVQQSIPADLVIDCSGQSTNWSLAQDPLIQDLFHQNNVIPGPHGMGIVANEGNEITPRLFAIGPMLRGARWETTAVAELRRQVTVVRDAILQGH